MKTEHGIEYNKTEFKLTPAKQGGGWVGWYKLRPRFEKQIKTRELAKLKQLRNALRREFNDENIVQTNGMHYYTFKYKVGSGRARPWMKLEYSKVWMNMESEYYDNILFLWLRVNPKTFHDEKHLTEYYDDNSKDHGNRRLDFMKVDLEDILNLVRQSYAFRKMKNSEEMYSAIVEKRE